MPPKEFIILRIKPNVVFVDICVKFVGTQNLGDLYELIVVVMAVEEGFLTEYL